METIKTDSNKIWCSITRKIPVEAYGSVEFSAGMSIDAAEVVTGCYEPQFEILRDAIKSQLEPFQKFVVNNTIRELEKLPPEFTAHLINRLTEKR